MYRLYEGSINTEVDLKREMVSINFKTLGNDSEERWKKSIEKALINSDIYMTSKFGAADG